MPDAVKNSSPRNWAIRMDKVTPIAVLIVRYPIILRMGATPDFYDDKAIIIKNEKQCK